MDKTKRGVRMNEMRNKMRNARRNTHLYSFNGKIFQQTSGGPIGLRATCACARVVMNSWDIAWMRKMEMNNVVVDLGMRYMDDIRLFLGSLVGGGMKVTLHLV